MIENRLLDIVIPSFNRPQRLFKLLETGLALAMPGVYFVIIDDGSCLSEYVDGVGEMDTQAVCEYFQSPAIVYIRNSQNIGLANSWIAYYEYHCQAKYTLSMVDKDFFVDKSPILNALHQLEQNDALSMVVIPLLQEDRAQQHLLIDFDYPVMSGRNFISRFIHDVRLQHCASYGVKRVSHLRAAGVPKNLQLAKFGLEDAFGIDIDLIFRLAPMGDIAFEKKPHIKRVLMDGATERYPLTFAYTYYQYAKHALQCLKKDKMIQMVDAKQYIGFWLLLILRGLVVAYRPVHGSEMEKGTARIQKHLKIPIHVYLLKEFVRYRIKMNEESIALYRLSLQLIWQSRRKKLTTE